MFEIQKLNCGYFYKPVILNGLEDFDVSFIDHLNRIASGGDSLKKNYNLKAIRRMLEYGYVYNAVDSDLVMMVGIQDFHGGCFRAGSRTYVHPSYRRMLFSSPDGLEVTSMQILNHVKKANFLFESRFAENTGTLRWLMRNPLFAEWQIYPQKIQLAYRDNWQWIMYKLIKGELGEHIENITYRSDSI